MTTANTASPVVDTWEMVMAHKIYRREFRILPAIIRAVEPGAKKRAKLVGDHLGRVVGQLHHHHQAEDELLWPLMLKRAGMNHEVVLRMEAQHERLEPLLDRLDELNSRWKAAASAPVRDELADVLAQASAVLDEHLADEERDLLPLVPGNISVEEWEALNHRARTGGPTPSLRTALVLLGFALEDATPKEREGVLASLPAPARALWKWFGPRTFAKARDEIRHG